MKAENEIQAVLKEETTKPFTRAKLAHVDGAAAENGETIRVKSPLTLAIESAADRAHHAATAAAWRAGRREILRAAIELVNGGYITRTAASAAWQSTNGLKLHVTSARENNGSLQQAGPTGRYWFDGKNASIFDAIKNLGNVARGFNIRYYEDRSAREKEKEALAKINAAAAAAAKEAKRLSMIEEMNAAEKAGDYAKALEISKILLNW